MLYLMASYSLKVAEAYLKQGLFFLFFGFIFNMQEDKREAVWFLTLQELIECL